MKLTCVIVDDEQLARAYLSRLVLAVGVTVAGEAGDAASALSLVQSTAPDIVFLDIEMPGMNGLDFAGKLREIPGVDASVVFVTGYSEHAVDAFSHQATDYLLKPVSNERLLQCLLRIHNQRTHSSEEADIQRLPVRGISSILLVPIADIVCITSREKKVFVRMKDGVEHRALQNLTQLEERLSRNKFIRIHGSYVVPTNHITELMHLGNHEYEVRLSDGRRAPVGRTRINDLKRALGLDTHTRDGDV
jgi:two-component system LytT family response regulator